MMVEAASDEARSLLLSVTSGGRHAALVFARRGDKLRPISCRAMRRKEEAYDAATQEERPRTGHEERAERSRRDATLREFKDRDLGGDIASPGTAVVVRPQRPTSILLSDELKAPLRKRGG